MGEVPEELLADDLERTIEIVASVSAKIPTGQYENFSPFYSAKLITKCNGDMVEVISRETDLIRAVLNKKLDEDYERVRIENIKSTRQDLRFYTRGEKSYPSVTSVQSAINPISFDADKLRQYASRGSIVHAQVDHFFKTGVWETDILKIPQTKTDYLIVTQGSLKLKWTDCSPMGFWEKYGKDFEVVANEQTLYNDEYMYAGTADLVCLYQGKKTLADFKTASNYDNDKLEKYWGQTAAYARCLEGVEQLMIIPLNPSNKSGFGAPIIETDINRYFALFLQDRAAFKQIYGI